MNDFGLLVVRLVAGGYIIKYGFPKFRDADGSFAKEFESFGFHPASTYVKRAGLTEVTAGALIILGAFGPVGPMLLLADMVVAAVTTTEHAKRFDLDQHEEQALFAISADFALNVRAFDRTWLRNLSVLGAFAGAAFMLSQRGRTP